MQAHRRRLLSLAVVLIFILSGCSPVVESSKQTLSVYATFYPIYALASLITQEVPDLELHCLVQPQDGCLRNYQLSDWDLYLLNYSADAVLAGGRGLESFEETLEALSEERLSLSQVLYGLELYQANSVDHEEATHFDGSNPHLYMSVDGAMQIMESLVATMSILDPRYAETYESNLQLALEKLSNLKTEIQEKVNNCSGQPVAILNEALFYVAQDYHMDIVATVVRESGTNLYDDALESCLNTLQESGAKIVLIERQAPKPLLDALEDAGYVVAQMDVLSTWGETDGFEGYFTAQRANAEAAANAVAILADEENIDE